VSAPVEPRRQDLGQTITAKAASPAVPFAVDAEATIPAPSGVINAIDATDQAAPKSREDEPVTPRRRGRLTGGATSWIGRQRPFPWLIALVVVAVAIGSVLRFITSSHIWLDEALTVEISGRHLPQLFGALRHDGSPPLYYLLLHYWMDLFGRGDVAVRALSGVLSLATLPLAWFAGRRVAQVAASFGHIEPHAVDRTGTAVLLLFATSPYAIRYGTETRMYSLFVFLVLLFALVLARALEQPSLRRWAAVTGVTAALAYTHYWTLLMLATVAFFLLLQARRRSHYRKLCHQALYAMLAAGVLFLPWLPTFVFQMLHTGTPWASQVHAEVLLDTVFSWAGPASAGALLALVLMLMAFIGYTARPSGNGLHLQLSGRVPGRYLVAMWLVPLVLAYGTYAFGGSAYAERYTGISLPPFLLLAGLGIGLLPSRATVSGLLALISVLGLVGGRALNGDERTNAAEVATRIQQQARPGDVVGYCPDQLAPAVHRMLVRDKVTGITEVAFADASGPALVDWVDYAKRMEQASPTAFAHELDQLAGPDGSVYLVSADGYRTLGDDCSEVADQLSALGRDPVAQVGRRRLLESSTLVRFSTKR
jgi:mannosyltransferase